MNARILLFALGIVLILLMVVGCGGADPTPTPIPTADPGAALVASRCTTCHPLGNIEASRYDAAGWAAIVDRMIGNGAQLNTEQKQFVVAYLAKAYPK